jgi:hypothetical protein
MQSSTGAQKTMTQNHIRPPHQQRRAPTQQPQGDSLLRQFNDDDLERALKTVSCNPKDIVQFLRSASYR